MTKYLGDKLKRFLENSLLLRDTVKRLAWFDCLLDSSLAGHYLFEDAIGSHIIMGGNTGLYGH